MKAIPADATFIAMVLLLWNLAKRIVHLLSRISAKIFTKEYQIRDIHHHRRTCIWSKSTFPCTPHNESIAVEPGKIFKKNQNPLINKSSYFCISHSFASQRLTSCSVSHREQMTCNTIIIQQKPNQYFHFSPNWKKNQQIGKT